MAAWNKCIWFLRSRGVETLVFKRVIQGAILCIICSLSKGLGGIKLRLSLESLIRGGLDEDWLSESVVS